MCPGTSTCYCPALPAPYGGGHLVEAANTAAELRRRNVSEGARRFVYSTWAWLVEEYFNSTAGCATAHRSEADKAVMEAAIRRGDVGWNAKALNLLPELADKDLYAASLQVAARLNARFNTTWGREQVRVRMWRERADPSYRSLPMRG